MEKNTIWAIVLSVLVLVVFMFIQMVYFPEQVVNQNALENTNEVVSSTDVQVENNTASTSSDILENDISVKSDENLQEETFVITTEKVKVTFTNRGGDIISYELLDHKDGDVYVQMADNITESNRAFSVAFGSSSNGIINDIFNVKQIDDKTIGFYKTFIVNNEDGTTSSFVLAKQYTFKDDDYIFRLDISIDGDETMKELVFGNTAYTVRTSPQIGPTYNAKSDRYEYRSFMSFENDKKKKVRLAAGQTKIYDKEFTWTGVSGKYFEIIGIPLNKSSMHDVLYSCAMESDEKSNAQILITRDAITERDTKDTYYFYVGPKTEKNLKIYNNADDNAWKLSGLRLNESIEATGMLSWLESFLKWCMEILYKIIPNWGVSIIILTILIKLLLFPLTKKSSLSTLKMQEVQPRMQEIQLKYKDQPEKMNMELSKLYKETGYNPLSGCLPLLIQFPIIIAMYNLFNNYFEFRGAMFIPGWIPDLSSGDSIYTLKFSLPLGLGTHIRLLPIIYLLSQLVFGKLNQTANNAAANGMQMKLMTYGMPIFFFFIFYNAPSGLLIYWTVSNILQLIQQMFLNRMIKEKREEIERNKENEKKVFVPRKKK